MLKKSDKPNALLIYPPNVGGRQGAKGIYYPLGIGYMAAVIRDEYNVRFHDLNLDYNLSPDLSTQDMYSIHVRNVLEAQKYDVLLIGGVYPKNSYVKLLIEISRDICDSKIILGGSYINPALHVLPDYLNADYYVLGEGEVSILPLLDSIFSSRSIDSVPNIAYSKNGKIVTTLPPTKSLDLDTIPFPARDLSDFNIYKRYFAKSQPLVYSAHMIASRGCPFNCLFCKPAFGRQQNIRSPQNIMEEMNLLNKDYGCIYFHFHDEMFLGGKKQNIQKLCEYILKHKPGKYTWGATINHQLLDKEELGLMRRSGCVRLSFGVESGSEAILREFRKKHNLKKLQNVLSWCTELGIDVDISLLTNSFSETTETLAETKEYLLSLTDNFFRNIPTLNFLIPIPGTDFYTEAKKRNLVSSDDLNNILELEEESRYELRTNLTKINTELFMKTVSEINRSFETTYKRKHPVQAVASAIGNLDHFRLKDTVRYAAQGNLKPMFEGLLWAFSQGDLNTKPGKIYKWMADLKGLEIKKEELLN